MMIHCPGFKDPIEQLLSICQDRKCKLALLKWDFTPNCFPKYKIIRVLDHDLNVCITQDDKIKLLRVDDQFQRSLPASVLVGQGEREKKHLNHWVAPPSFRWYIFFPMFYCWLLP